MKTTDFDKLVSSRAVNKTAALVTQWTEENESEYESLKKRLLDFDKAFVALKNSKAINKQKLKDMGVEKFKLQERMSFLRDHKSKYKPESIEKFFVDICKSRMTKTEFTQILKMAIQKSENIHERI